MRAFLLLAVILALFCYVAADEHCLDSQFTVTSSLLDPSKHYDDTHVIYFDSVNNRQYIDITEIEPTPAFRGVLFRFDQGKMYTFDKVAKTCETHKLDGKLQPYCLASNATHVGQITLGGRMTCDVWEENMFGFQIRLVISSTQYIPVNLLSRGGHQDALFQEWFDYTNGVNDPSVFNPPAYCSAAVAKNNANNFDTRALLKKVNGMMRAYAKH